MRYRLGLAHAQRVRRRRWPTTTGRRWCARRSRRSPRTGEPFRPRGARAGGHASAEHARPAPARGPAGARPACSSSRTAGRRRHRRARAPARCRRPRRPPATMPPGPPPRAAGRGRRATCSLVEPAGRAAPAARARTSRARTAYRSSPRACGHRRPARSAPASAAAGVPGDEVEPRAIEVPLRCSHRHRLPSAGSARRRRSRSKTVAASSTRPAISSESTRSSRDWAATSPIGARPGGLDRRGRRPRATPRLRRTQLR